METPSTYINRDIKLLLSLLCVSAHLVFIRILGGSYFDSHLFMKKLRLTVINGCCSRTVKR